MSRRLACLFLPHHVELAIVRMQRSLAGYSPLLPPHITLAPPRNGGLPLKALRDFCYGVGPVDLTIGPPGRFTDPELVAYLQVGGPGLELLGAMHTALGGRAEDFVPHVTVLRGLSAHVVDAALEATHRLGWSVAIDMVHVVDISQSKGSLTWRPIDQIPLTTQGANDGTMS